MAEELTIRIIEQGLTATAETIETATFGMGCFWGPESRFGSLPGVIRTRVGFSGGTSLNPSYRKMGDHTETVEVDFDPTILSYEEILLHFWNHHYPNRDQYKGRQYISLIRFRSPEQERMVEKVKRQMEQKIGEEIETDIAAFTDFTLAEERHQKYYLKRYPKAMEQLAPLYPDVGLLADSTFAARLNGFVKGFGNRQNLKSEITGWNIAPEYQEILINKLMAMKW